MMYDIDVPGKGNVKAHVWLGDTDFDRMTSLFRYDLPVKTRQMLEMGLAILLHNKPVPADVDVTEMGGNTWEQPQQTLLVIGSTPYTREYNFLKRRLQGYKTSDLGQKIAFPVMDADPLLIHIDDSLLHSSRQQKALYVPLFAAVLGKLQNHAVHQGEEPSNYAGVSPDIARWGTEDFIITKLATLRAQVRQLKEEAKVAADQTQKQVQQYEQTIAELRQQLMEQPPTYAGMKELFDRQMRLMYQINKEQTDLLRALMKEVPHEVAKKLAALLQEEQEMQLDGRDDLYNYIEEKFGTMMASIHAEQKTLIV